jgi:hypothetical protein
VLEDRLPPALLIVKTIADDTTPNDGSVSLREAITAINNGSAGGDNDIINENPGTFGVNDTIQFALGSNPQTITLGGQEPVIYRNMNILGPGAGNLKIDAHKASGVFEEVNASVSFSGLTIANGSSSGIFSDFGSLTVANCTFTNNSNSGSGGGISNYFARLTVTDCTFSGNHADEDGGGIVDDNDFNFGYQPIVTNCTFSGNDAGQDGGGIWTYGDRVSVTNCTFSNNNHGVNGGAVEVASGTMMVTNCAFSLNSAYVGAGIDNRGDLTVANSTLSINVSGFGGGIHNEGMLKVTDSTLWGNFAAAGGGGGGLNNSGTATLTNCTVSRNFANALDTAGGIDTSSRNTNASTTLVNCTVAGNINYNAAGPGGLFAGRYGSGQANVTLGNTIVANNSGHQFGTAGPSGGAYVGPGTFVSRGHNLSSDASGNLSQPSDQQNTDPLLGPLQDNGNDGPLAGAPDSQQVVLTMALLPGSPAIDQGSLALAVDPATALPLFTDQRGFDRVENSKPDIGAFEVQLYLVYSNADSVVVGGGTLRSALSNANQAGGSVIAFTAGGTINLASPLPPITRSVQILGPGPNDLTVQRSTAAGTPNFRIFTVGGPTGAIHDVSVTIDGMTIANGNASLVNGNTRFGGGIFNVGHLTVSNCILSGNTAQIDGGGIDNQAAGTLRVIDCTFVGNSAQATDGGIANLGTLIISGSTLSGNTAPIGGGIGSNGPVQVTNCTFAGNIASYGGGIFYRGRTLTVTSSTFTGNSASYGGGIYSNAGTVTLTNSVFAGNSAYLGGGIANEIASDSSSTLKATNCTFSGNSAFGGGGLHNEGTASLTNCTVSGNSANTLDTAAGIETSAVNSPASTTLVNCTVAGNTNHYAAGPGGLFAGRYGTAQATVTLQNTIVANNSGNQFGTAGASVGPGTFVSQGHNLSSDSSGNSFAASTDLHGLDPLLAPLGNYGGPLAGAPGSQQVVPTIALLPGSPAIDSGSDALAVDPDGHPLATDQRGFSRFTSTVDIGAFESRGFVLSVAGGNNQQARVNTLFAAPLSVTVSSPFGEPVQGGVVTFAVPPSGASATFPAANTSTLDASGHAAVSVRANTITGTYAITASARGANLTSFTLTNLHGPVTHFGIAGPSPSSVPADTAFSLTVTALDEYGNVATDYRGRVRFDSSDPRATLPDRYTYTASDQGVHTFTGLVLRRRDWQTITVIDDSDHTIRGTISIDVL